MAFEMHPYAVMRYGWIVIQSFKDKATRAVWESGRHRKFDPRILSAVERKLTMLHSAHVLSDLRSPPGNKLEKLEGDRSGQYSIRVNDQWRICFTWTSTGPEEVEITDYH